MAPSDASYLRLISGSFLGIVSLPPSLPPTPSPSVCSPFSLFQTLSRPEIGFETCWRRPRDGPGICVPPFHNGMAWGGGEGVGEGGGLRSRK